MLIRGKRGNAKSTAVRGMAHLLEPAPLIEVPLGATLEVPRPSAVIWTPA